MYSLEKAFKKDLAVQLKSPCLTIPTKPFKKQSAGSLSSLHWDLGQYHSFVPALKALCDPTIRRPQCFTLGKISFFPKVVKTTALTRGRNLLLSAYWQKPGICLIIFLLGIIFSVGSNSYFTWNPDPDLRLFIWTNKFSIYSSVKWIVGEIIPESHFYLPLSECTKILVYLECSLQIICIHF